MPPVSLAQVDWPAAASRAERSNPLLAASLNSLAARFSEDFATGSSLLRRAAQADPLNPLHDLRLALFHARFGDLPQAAATLQRLQRQGLSAPIIAYLRALVALRSGRPDQARSMTAALEAHHPDFVSARFLRAETQIITANRASTLERHLRSLPAGGAWEANWADLLLKLVLLHPEDGPAIAERYANNIAGGSDLRRMLEKAIGWVRASPEQIGQLLEQERPGSRTEAVLLECLLDKLDRVAAGTEAARAQALRLLTRLRAQYPERAGVRQLLRAFQTRQAASLAADGSYEAALRFVERTIAEAPHDLMYYQNRAALFTLMRESSAYHEAWATLNAHQYRLVLLGLGGPLIGQIVKTHRLFAQQSRGGVERTGRRLFQVVRTEDDDTRLRVDSEAVAADPDLLRQWLHHKRAELLFRHLAVGQDGANVLLEPSDRDAAVLRADALKAMSQSLRVLVPDEGGQLCDVLCERWSAAALTANTRYLPAAASPDAADPAAKSGEDPGPAEPEEHEQTRELRQEHLATLADLCLICLYWRPQSEHLWIAEEILDWTREEAAFADAGLLAEMKQEQGHAFPYPLRVFANRLHDLAGEAALASLPEESVQKGVDMFRAELLREMAFSAYHGFDGWVKDRAAHAMEYIKRARACHPSEPHIELSAAELLSLGEYYDDARKALGRFRRDAGAEYEWLNGRADKLDELLAERRKKGEAGNKFKPEADTGAAITGDAHRVAELLSEIDEAPKSWRLYAALVKELVLAGRLDEAVEWADRCASHCLNRTDQIGARGLAIEARGLKTLAVDNARAAKLYALGGYEPAHGALEALAGREEPLGFPLLYLLGRCQLNLGMPDAAVASFRAAFEACDQSLYRSVLRQLANDIDQAYLAVARGTIDSLVEEGDFDTAIAEALRVFARLKAPAAWLVDVARMFCSVAVGRLKAAAPAEAPIYGFELVAPWREQLDQALRAPGDAARAVAVAELGRDVDPGSAARAQVVIERATALQRQITAAAVLQDLSQLITDGKFEQMLALVDALDPDIATEPRLKRIRILALLALQRFGEADEAFAQFGQAGSSEIREFLANYTALAFRQRVAAVQKSLRGGKAREALDALENLVAPTAQDEADLVYCKAFAMALEGYEKRKRGDRRGARLDFEHALQVLETYFRSAEPPPHLRQLFDRLDMEADQNVG